MISLPRQEVAFFQKVWWNFFRSPNLKKKYSKKLSWAWNLNFPPITVKPFLESCNFLKKSENNSLYVPLYKNIADKAKCITLLKTRTVQLTVKNATLNHILSVRCFWISRYAKLSGTLQAQAKVFKLNSFLKSKQSIAH